MGHAHRVAPADHAFNTTRERLHADNYLLYIAVAGGGGLNPAEFWTQGGLKILVTPSTVLRYHLHRTLNWLLCGSDKDVFGNVTDVAGNIVES